MLLILELLVLIIGLGVALPVQTHNLTDNQGFDEESSQWISPHYYPTPQGGRLQGVWQDAYTKAKALVSQMTIVEKVNLTTGTGWQLGPCVGNTGSVPRFGIPNLCLQDGPLGVRLTDFSTGYPSGMATGATFNKDLFLQRGQALGHEFNSKGVHIALGPAVGPLGVKARGGRNFEAFGSDPYLQGIAAAATIKGLQENNVMACVKHFIGNEQDIYRQPSNSKVDPEYDPATKESISANIPDRAMHELYLWPFADSIRAGVGSVMCSYNRVNNTYSCENSYMINHLLKEELGFQGFVVSDWAAQMSGAYSAISGLDMSMPGELLGGWNTGKSYWGQNLTKAVYNETVPIERLDDMATRILAALYATNSFPTKDRLPNFSSFTTKEYGNEFFVDKTSPVVKVNHFVDPSNDFTEDTALKVAEESIVLLKNEKNTLPISPNKVRKLLLSGIAAGPDPKGYECSDQSCVDGALFEGWGSGSVGYPKYQVTPFEEISANARKNKMQFDYIRESFDLTQVSTVASDAHMSIVVVSAVSGEGYLIIDGNRGDKNNVTLWHNSDNLIKAVAENCANTVVVITSTGQVDVESFADHPNVTAIVWAGPLGDRSGTAIANILFGNANPSGHLPFTVAKSNDDYIPIVTYNPPNGEPEDNTLAEHDLLVDYRYFEEKNIEPRYAFGYGLSYNEYKVSNAKVSAAKKVDEELPQPKLYLAEYSYNKTEEINNPEDAFFPSNARRIQEFLYPYLDSNVTLKDGNYEYPDGYSTEQRTTPIQPGGGLGGNDALWEVAYKVEVDVQNLGNSTDKFVPQLYLKHPEDGKFETPVQLRGFEKVELSPGEKKTVEFELLRRDLSVWDTTRQSWIVESGTYEALIGVAVNDIKTSVLFTI
uniref:Beta-glucosidase 2 n=1 Tax=Saccharomycopsis fibuligera TaxID=4944 RepID=BGL2_SACFI|nr:RecName: Full=Beta-glucosidase 2; AltName: Full=Beta-D-glucoside glucohydrolase; AltName: Full=Cellobiase; AltName: Full=Gentiobiase; Flags: Precursor [Saccharomycopsis fibuligera]AAA34315.1 beta-glucosidase 2 precursor [Saccharomycopsis fibuligera]